MDLKKKLTRPGVSNAAAAVVRGVQNRKMNGDYAWPFHRSDEVPSALDGGSGIIRIPFYM